MSANESCVVVHTRVNLSVSGNDDRLFTRRASFCRYDTPACVLEGPSGRRGSVCVPADFGGCT